MCQPCDKELAMSFLTRAIQASSPRNLSDSALSRSGLSDRRRQFYLKDFGVRNSLPNPLLRRIITVHSPPSQGKNVSTPIDNVRKYVRPSLLVAACILGTAAAFCTWHYFSKQQIARHYQETVRHYQNEEWTTAVRGFEEMAQQHPRSAPDARFNLALSLFQNGNYARSLRVLRKLKEQPGDLFQARLAFNIGNCHYRLGRTSSALHAYRQALTLARRPRGSSQTAEERRLRRELVRRARHNMALARANLPEIPRVSRKGKQTPTGNDNGRTGIPSSGAGQKGQEDGSKKSSQNARGAGQDGSPSVVQRALGGDGGPVINRGEIRGKVDDKDW